jgi:metallophosphoesterase (TIGR00282 family)
VRILFIGDIFATPGLKAAGAFLSAVRSDYDFTIANGENVAGGFGITRKHFEQLLAMGVDVVTLGNHTWDQQEVIPLLEATPRLIRPLNYPVTAPGLGYTTLQARSGESVTVIQAMGRIYMEPIECPFFAIDGVLETLSQTDAIIVDFHAEATSEKKVMGFHLAGRVTAVVGTHTHVQTADETVMKGTGYITDVGMTGVQESSIGMRFEEVHQRLVHKLPARFKPADKAASVCAVALEVQDGKTVHIERIQWREQL